MLEYITYGLIAVIVIQDILHRFERKGFCNERKDLYDRIMCKDIIDYKAIKSGSKTNVKSARQIAQEKWQGVDTS